MNKNKEDNNVKSIWKKIRSKNGKRWSFVIFYIFFFIFLALYMMPNQKNTNEPVKENFPFKITNLENNSYSFSYTIMKNNDIAEYLGVKKDKEINLKDDRGEYYLKYQNGSLKEDNNQNIPYIKLLDIYEMKRIIKNSKLISETKLTENNEYIYKYEIKNKYLSDIFETNYEDELINEINIKTNSKKEIKEISLDLLNYEKNNQTNLDKFLITLIYGDDYE